MVTRYVYDREDILFELDENDQIKVRYTHGPGIPALPAGRDEPMSVDRDTNGDGIFDVYYYHYDGLGSVTALTDATGTVVQSYVYDTFGKIVQQTGSVENTYRYTGREYDEKAGLYYYRARYYDANTGRFIQGDPIGFNGGDVNFYAYVQNNPANFIDPEGKWVNIVIGGVIGAAIGGTNAIFYGGSIWKGALYGGATGALTGMTFGGNLLANAGISGGIGFGMDIFQQKRTNPCADINYGSAAASGIAAALGSGVGSAVIKGGTDKILSAILGSGSVAAPVNVGLTWATQPVNR